MTRSESIRRSGDGTTVENGTECRGRAPRLLGLRGLPYGLTVLFASGLLFLLEPIVGKVLLPRYGGAAEVWTACLLFFQLVVYVGYFYSDRLVRLDVRRQCQVQSALVVLSLVGVLALVVWSPPHASRLSGYPHLAVLVDLAALALPTCFVLCTASSLVQSWATYVGDQRPVYWLYAVGNASALVVLLSYPFVIEPRLSIRSQEWVLCLGYLVFAGCFVWVAITTAGRARWWDAAEGPPALGPGHSELVVPLWASLAAGASLLFVATTEKLCHEVAPIPLLWTLPLAVYLLSFVLCFTTKRCYARGLFGPLYACGVAALVALDRGLVATTLAVRFCLYMIVMFAGVMICHGELVRELPPPPHLTRFYRAVALGSLLGGAFAALLAPMMLPDYWEFEIALWFIGVTSVASVVVDKRSWIWRGSAAPAIGVVGGVLLLATWERIAEARPIAMLSLTTPRGVTDIPRTAWILSALALATFSFLSRRVGAHPQMAVLLLAASLGLLGTLLIVGAKGRSGQALERHRNFYGVLSVNAGRGTEGEPLLALSSGNTLHGFQYTAPTLRRLPTAYYGDESGLGAAVDALQRCTAGGLRVAVLGLGVGTIASYGRSGDFYRFYEINPAVIDLAGTRGRRFSYVQDTAARTEIVLGDGRLSIAQEPTVAGEGIYDLIVLDAFNGDAIPVHLLTVEALRLYLAHLSGPESLIAVHVSNRYVDLVPILGGAARMLGLRAVVVTSGGSKRAFPASWVLLSRGTLALGTVEHRESARPISAYKGVAPWTDAYSSVAEIIRW